MKKKLMIFLFFLFSALYFSNDLSTVVKETQEGKGAIPLGSELFGTGLITDWRVLSFALAIITVFVLAFARMLAEPLNLPDLKAWADMELVQAFVTVGIIVFILAAIQFIDAMILLQVNNSPGSPVKCEITDFCLEKISNFYIDGLVDLIKASARETFTQSINAARQAVARRTINCLMFFYPLPCLYGFYGHASNAFLMLDVERYDQEIEHYQSLIYSLSVQKFFVNNISFAVGPVLLFLGIVARSFFLTRKVGGLLIASALGIMVVFPMMYLWNMITLNVTVYGDKLFQGGDPDCPIACSYPVPVAYGVGTKSAKGSITYQELFNEEFNGNEELTLKIANGSLEEHEDIASCEYRALEYNRTHPGYYCPTECRELPYPYIITTCSDPKIELACINLPRDCKVIRSVSLTKEQEDICNLCPEHCKITPPLYGESSCINCFLDTDLTTDEIEVGPNPQSIPFNCRIAIKKWNNDINKKGVGGWEIVSRPENCLRADLDPAYIKAVNNCPADPDFPARSCAYVVPFTDPPSCECKGKHCCIDVDAPGYAKCNVSQCVNTASCGCEEGSSGICLSGPERMYWNTDTSNCSCKGKDCLAPGRGCEACLDAPNDYCLFKSNIVPNCPEECPPVSSDKPVLLSPAEFSKKSVEGMYGREDVKNVSKFFLSAYFLPLINILVTLMFIHAFSPMLGGDVSIPGAFKVL